jgi:hypothetical protein
LALPPHLAKVFSTWASKRARRVRYERFTSRRVVG